MGVRLCMQCRRCGTLVCQACSSNRIVLDEREAEERVCDGKNSLTERPSLAGLEMSKGHVLSCCPCLKCASTSTCARARPEKAGKVFFDGRQLCSPRDRE